MLNTKQQENLVELIDYEITHFMCDSVPKYQSFNDMHIKHSDKEEIQILTDLIVLNAYVLTNAKIKIDKCWFNILREDSTFGMHRHETFAGVYYLKNCTGHGTMIFCDGVERQLQCFDNSFQFISAGVYHAVPPYKGVDRYSVAYDLVLA